MVHKRKRRSIVKRKERPGFSRRTAGAGYGLGGRERRPSRPAAAYAAGIHSVLRRRPKRVQCAVMI